MACGPSGNPAPSITPNPFTSIFTPAFHNTFTNAIDALLSNCALTTPCRLIFGNSRFIQCTNCQGGIYKPGGPVYFPRGKVCPLCNGKASFTVEAVEDVYLMVNFDTKKFTQMDGAEKYPGFADDMAQTMCRVELYPKIVSAEKAILDMCNQCYSSNFYKRVSHPRFLGLGKQEYLLTTWQRISK